MPASTKSKLIVRVFGGIGNQLFSYAAARRLAIMNDMELIIDDVSGFKYDTLYKRSCQLQKFAIPCRKASPLERLEPFSRIRRYLRKWRNLRKNYFNRDYIVQDVFDFDKRLLEFHPYSDTYIEGYWHSEKYFKDIEDDIRRDLVIVPPQDNKNSGMAEKIREKVSVAVHFRYFSNKIGSPENLPSDYYEHAIRYIRDHVDTPHFYIFSDNPELAVDMLKLQSHEITVVNHNKSEDSAYADLWLMQQCKHFIIANSTFSWWGAWLCDNPEKIVIAPGMTKRTGVSWWGFDGLIPESWITV